MSCRKKRMCEFNVHGVKTPMPARNSADLVPRHYPLIFNALPILNTIRLHRLLSLSHHAAFPFPLSHSVSPFLCFDLTFLAPPIVPDPTNIHISDLFIALRQRFAIFPHSPQPAIPECRIKLREITKIYD